MSKPRTSGAHSLIDRARVMVAEPAIVPERLAGGLPAWLGIDAPETRGIGPYLDHTLLQPDATREQVIALCEEAIRYGVKAVCVNGCWAGLCGERLAGSAVAVATVVGFPLGAMASGGKAAETRLALGAGATEIDMVMALGHARGGEWQYVEHDIRAVVEAAGPAPVKVILETAALEPEEIAAACLVSLAAGAAFVKTSTGFHPAGGATREAVALMRRAVGTEMGVKASGGIRTAEAALAMLAAGASRIGTSSTAAMARYLGPGAPLLGELLL